MDTDTTHDGQEWPQAGSPSKAIRCTDGGLTQERVGTGVVNGEMRIRSRTRGPQTIYGAEMYDWV